MERLAEAFSWRSLVLLFSAAGVSTLLLSTAPSYRIPLGMSAGKHFSHGWGNRGVDGDTIYREPEERALVHLHGLDRQRAYRVAIRWRAHREARTASTLRIATNGREPVTFRAGTSFRSDHFEVPPAPENCLLLWLAPTAEKNIAVEGISVEPLARTGRISLPLLAVLILVPGALLRLGGDRRTWLACAGFLVLAYVGFVSSRPFDAQYAIVFHSGTLTAFHAVCLGSLYLGLTPWLSSRRRLPVAMSAGVLLATGVVLLYGHTLAFGFVSDDFAFVLQPNWSRVASSLTGSWLETNFLADYYRPMVVFTYTLDSVLYGPWSGGYHLTNLLLLAGCGFLVFRLMQRFVDDPRLCLLAALFFLLHPFNVLAGSWVAHRTDTLATLFYLGALVLWPNRILAVSLVAALAFMSKEITVTLPAALLLLDTVLLRRLDWSARSVGKLRPYVPISILWVAYLLLLLWRIPSFGERAARLASRTPDVSEGASSLNWFRWGVDTELHTLLTPLARVFESPELKFAVLVAAVALAMGLNALVSRLRWLEALSFERRSLSRRLVVASLLWTMLTVAPIHGVTGYNLYRMGVLLSVGASLLALGVLIQLFGAPGARGLRVVAISATIGWLSLLVNQSMVGSFEVYPYTETMVRANGWEYRSWSPYLPEAPSKALWLQASGRIDHSWPIYRREPPSSY